MSVRSYSKVWLHVIWSTQNREKSLTGKELRKKLSNYLYRYSEEKSIYMKKLQQINLLVNERGL